ncbi:MAG: transporter substrate-binding domain-containing protein [Fodinibius sp.]|nr:transporter substrate-binding domain-containing protein [Fodinibius sp.]
MHRIKKIQSRLVSAAIGMLSISLICASCVNKGEVEETETEKELRVSVVDPVDRDLADIKRSGTLRMITRYSSNTYFLHQGLEWGFEYELVSKFAKKHDLALEVVVIGPNENPYDLLNSGKGDLIAANYTATEERKKYVEFTRPYNIVNQLLVFSDGDRGDAANH